MPVAVKTLLRKPSIAALLKNNEAKRETTDASWVFCATAEAIFKLSDGIAKIIKQITSFVKCFRYFFTTI